MVLAIVPLPARPALLARLPQSARWPSAARRTPARSDTVRTTLLGNRRHTLAVLGYLKSDASAFERLSLAGRMLKEAAAHHPAARGPHRHRRRRLASAALEALLAATLTHAFALPSFRARGAEERAVRRVVLLDAR